MERIKQALDKARLERAAEPVVPAQRVDEAGGASLTAADIQYSRTRVQALGLFCWVRLFWLGCVAKSLWALRRSGFQGMS